MSAPRGLLWQGLFVLLAVALFLTLGFWQLRRLDWKNALLADVAARAQSAPVSPPARAQWAALGAEDYRYLHVRVQGRFDLAHQALVFTPAPEGAGAEPGYFVLAPLELDQGGVLFVNRGFVAQSKSAAGPWRAEPRAKTELVGWLQPPQRRNFFTPADDPPRGAWYTADPAEIAAAFGLKDAAPFLLEEEAEGAPADGLHRAGAVDATLIPNNHLSYAVTWFGLALAFSILFAVYAKDRSSPRKLA